MARKTFTRRALVPSLAALPLVATLFPPLQAVAQVTRAILFKGSSRGAVPGRENWVFGWVAETPEGWTGMGSDWSIAIAEQDLPGSAAFAGVVVVPKGTPSTVN